MRQKNLAKREELLKRAATARPHVILGFIAGGQVAACDLARMLVRPEELAPDAQQRVSLPTATATATGAEAEAEACVAPSLALGIREHERKMVFEHLPLLAADMSTRREMNAQRRVEAEGMTAHHEAELGAGVVQANVLAALVDLRNAKSRLRIGGESSRRFRSLGSRMIPGGLRCKANSNEMLRTGGTCVASFTNEPSF